jgi:hypothetical protein
MKKLAIVLALISTTAVADTPVVKMSLNGICHSESSPYYNRVKNFTAFDTLEDCVAAGGRLPQ